MILCASLAVIYYYYFFGGTGAVVQVLMEAEWCRISSLTDSGQAIGLTWLSWDGLSLHHYEFSPFTRYWVCSFLHSKGP
jgi:hypothetical protein